MRARAARGRAVSQFDTRERDTFIRRMERRGATMSHTNGRMRSVGLWNGSEYRHLTFSDRPEDYGRVWLTVIGEDMRQKEIRWVDGTIAEWFEAMRVDGI